MTDTVLLAGATGYIGSRVARELRDHGYHLQCPVRDPDAPAAAALAALTGDADQFAEAVTLIPCELSSGTSGLDARALSTPDAVISCLASRSGGVADSDEVDYRANHHLLDWARRRGVSHFTLLSAICVQKPRLAFQRAKQRFETELAASGLSYSIVRPTAFFKSLSGQLGRVRDGKPFLLFGDGKGTACKPIAEDDLARFLRMTLEDPSLRGLLPIGGPGPAITPAEQAQLLAELTGTPLRTRSVPPGLLRAIARLLAVPGRISARVADKAEFARIGHYYATESMLLWDPIRHCYDADATPEFGTITLEDSYRAQLAGEESQDPGQHAMFTRRND